MFQVTDNQMIYLTRGDSCTITLAVLSGNDFCNYRYQIEDGDKIYFGLTEPNQKFEDAILKKVFTKEDVDKDGNIEIKFAPTDTEFLKEQMYFYTIKLANQDQSMVETLIDRKRFFIV